jgi:hypothetical protein
MKESPKTTYGDRRMLAYTDFEQYYNQMKAAYDFVNGKPTS